MLLGLFAALMTLDCAAAPRPDEVVLTTSHNMVKALEEHHDELLADIATVARLVLGPHWRQATREQRTRFIAAFKRLMINSYAKALLLHSNKEIQVQPVPAGELASRRVSVRSIVQSSTGKAISIIYRMRLTEGVWKIYDFNVEGVSLILNYKHSFAEQVSRSGLDSLIKTLDEKNARFKL